MNIDPLFIWLAKYFVVCCLFGALIAAVGNAVGFNQ